MKIYITTDAVGGVWDYTATLASGLVDAANDVRVAVVGSPGDDQLSQLPPQVEVASADYRLEWMPDAGDDVRDAATWLSADARAWGADLVHLNQMAYAASEFGVPKIVVVHSDVLSWFAESLGTAAPAVFDDYARWVAAGLEGADIVVAPSHYQSRLTESHYGRGADRVVHNAARGPDVPPRPRTRPLVVSVGRAWDQAKGMAVVDRAAGLLNDGTLDVHVFGDTTGPAGQRFAAEHVVCHGRAPRDEIDRWLARTSVYVGASVYEPFGLAPLEAALHGTALVLSDIPSFRELWDDCAVFFPRGDAGALAATLNELTPDLERCKALGSAARARALSWFGTERFTSEYIDIYAGLFSTLEAHQPCA